MLAARLAGTGCFLADPGYRAFGDKGALFNMGRKDFARGLITCLFTVVTIGTAAILVLSTLTGNSGNTLGEKQFDEGKEFLLLLLGIFGTIVGHYFGAESSRGPQPEGLKLSSLDITPDRVLPGASVTAKAVVKGGVPPCKFGVAIGNDNLIASESAPAGGWLTKEVATRAARRAGSSPPYGHRCGGDPCELKCPVPVDRVVDARDIVRTERPGR